MVQVEARREGRLIKKQSKQKLLVLIIAVVIVSSVYLFWGLDPETWQYVMSRRLPKFFAFILTGSMIATSTILFQTIANNRILTPSVLGLDSLYVMIQTLIVLVFNSLSITLPNTTWNFAISTILMLGFAFVLYKLLFSKGQNMYFLLLVGTILGTLFRSVTGFFQMILDPNEFALLQGKLFASFNNIQDHLLLVTALLTLLVLPFIYDYFMSLDVLHLGKENAVSLGLDYNKHTRSIFLVVALFTSITTALVGPITFLGLIVANLSYELSRSYKHTHLILFGSLIGMLFLVGGQMIIERLFNFSIPLSVMINLVGGVYFVYLLVKERAA